MTERPYRIRILVVDDHPGVRCGLRDLLGTYSDMQVIGESEEGHSALDAAKRLSPDVILLDVGLPGLSGIEVARRLHHSAPTVRIIMLTNYYDVESVAKTMDGNAHGCLVKGDAAEMLGEAIRAVYRGERWMPLTGLED
jgi:DNA-binding NarL/FixJ family response regulator